MTKKLFDLLAVLLLFTGIYIIADCLWQVVFPPKL